MIKFVIPLLLVINSMALTVTGKYQQGLLTEVTDTHFIIKAKSGKYVKVKKFIKNPQLGKIISYPTLSKYSIEVDEQWHYNQAQKNISNPDMTSDIAQAYLEALGDVSLNGSYKVESLVDQYSFFDFTDLFINKACAEDQSCDKTCFFGGWASERRGSYCQAPWKTKKSTIVTSIDEEVYSNKVSCGGKNVFRCNPKIFGQYHKSLDPIQNVHTKASMTKGGVGICVKAAPNYHSVTKKCLDASAKVPGFKESLKERYKNNPKTFDKIISNVNCFCSSNKTNKAAFSCKRLRERLETIFEKTPVVAPAPTVVPVAAEKPKLPEDKKEEQVKVLAVKPEQEKKNAEVEVLDIKPKTVPIKEQEIVEEKPIIKSDEIEEPIADELTYYSCEFDGDKELFKGKDSNCIEQEVCLKKVICKAVSENGAKYNIASKLLSYCPCSEGDATKCANARPDKKLNKLNHLVTPVKQSTSK